jgi:hypothetical protein
MLNHYSLCKCTWYVLIGFRAMSCCKIIERTLPLRKLKHKLCKRTKTLGIRVQDKYAHKSLHRCIHYSIIAGITVKSARWPMATLAFGKIIASPTFSVLISLPSSNAITLPFGKSVKFSTSSEKFNEKFSP